MKKPFASAKRFAIAKDVARHDEGKMFEIPVSGLPWRTGFVTVNRPVCHDEDNVHHSEDIIYVSILVLSQSRLLSHNSQACKFFPNIK